MATAEERQAELGAVLAGVRVRDVMTPDPDTMDSEMSVADFLRDIAVTRHHSSYPLLDSASGLQGMITLNRLRSVPSEDRASTRLRDVACHPSEIPRAEPSEPLTALLARMDGCPDGRALVFERNRLIGVVSPSDISRVVTLRGLDVRWPDGADVAVEQPRPPPAR